MYNPPFVKSSCALSACPTTALLVPIASSFTQALIVTSCPNSCVNELLVDNQALTLGNKESILFKLFMKHSNEVISHDRIYKELWDFDEEPSDTALRTYIKNIRKIIGKDRIVSIKKQGYKFTS